MDKYLTSMYLTPPPATSSSAAAAATQPSSTQQPPGGVKQPCRELLPPEATANPVLQRFYYAVGQKALYGRAGYTIPPGDTDEVVAGAVDPPLDYMSGRAAALRESLAEVFPITVRGACQYRVQGLRVQARGVRGEGYSRQASY
jgi:hypothetical protein